MLPADFDEITIEHILQLAAEKIPENRLLDYKQELPGKGMDSKSKEFVADLSSFANAGGGDIIYGIVEEKDATGKNTGQPGSAAGVQLAGENCDQATLRLHQISQTKLDPAIPGLRIKAFSSPKNERFFVVRIPRSWLAPHMVLGGSSSFALRNDNAKIWMDREQIRQAFLFSDSIRGRVEQFRDSRIARILSGTLGVSLQPSWKRVTHVVPVAGLNGSPNQNRLI